MTYQAGDYLSVRPLFRSNGALNNSVDTRFSEADTREPAFAFAHDLGMVGSTKTAPILFTVGSFRNPLVQLLNISSVNTLRSAYYLTRYNNVLDMVRIWHTYDLKCAKMTLHRSPRSSMITPILWHVRYISTTCCLLLHLRSCHKALTTQTFSPCLSVRFLGISS